MKITGKCEECERQNAILGFSVTLIFGDLADENLVASCTSIESRKVKLLCLGCFQLVLAALFHATQNLGEEARQA
jgi:hypothetical protein